MSASSSVSDRPSHTAGTQKLNNNKCIYQVDQQVKFIHLQAEVDCLLQQLQNLQKQKLSSQTHKN
ncbi:MAG: hypothetical protein QNJ51_01860 [Calothrix sp. MO_167.B12]|nr:hypothetical protein [Calothrix sp. MO_167.B12]